MKLLKQGLALALTGAGLAVTPLAPAQAEPAGSGNDVSAMKARASQGAAVTREGATGKVGFIRAKGRSGDLLPGRAADTAAAAVDKAAAYVSKYAASFGARRGELEQTGVRRNQFGWTVTYQQSHRGVPVFGGTLKANVDAEGDLTSVSGFAVPGLDLDVTPARSRSAAAERAVDHVRAHPPTSEGGATADVSGLRAQETRLVVYRQGAVRGVEGEAVLAWQVEVTNVTEEGGTVRDMVILDARTLKPVNRWSMMTDALDRTLVTYDEETGSYPLVWQEGDPFPGDLDQDQQNLLSSSEESYWMFMNTWGVDSYDGRGAERVTLHNRPDSCPNASWNGSYTSYCDGVYSDDVVSHEWGHAYTEYNSGLIYQWQSGALNEAYSDIYGETLDLLNDREDAGEGDLTAKRPDGLCSTHTRGDITATIDAPEDVAGPCESAAAASFGPQFDTEGVTSEVVVATDAADDDGPSTTDGCSAITNPEEVSGSWAYVDRGTCPFVQKMANVEEAGATGIVFGNTGPGALSVSGNEEDLYGLMVSQADGTRIKSAGTVTMTVREKPREAADSYRWLVSEKSPAFGGAIRDMWNPTCYGDPGKVTDAEYHCTTDDNGGVHGNSGVPNHGYALLVDGGTFNGETVEGIGIHKAANIYFKAQNEYLTEYSDFVDHADSLEAACAALVDRPINEVTLERNESATLDDRISEADCDQVDAMIRAVELRTDPAAQCEWEPILAPGQGPRLDCGKGKRTTSLFSEDFEDGMGEWTADQEVVFEGGNGIPWTVTGQTHGSNDTRAAFAWDPSMALPEGGNCSGGDGDISSRDSIISPSVAIPRAARKPRLSFDHYVATEAGWDGGNVKVSVDGGDFEQLPQGAYVWNGPNGTLDVAAAGNTNPMAGQAAWTGTNPGETEPDKAGSWGTSTINLAKAGVRPGDDVRIRFDFGRDGCNGVDGWYVDNVELDVCAPPRNAASTTRARIKPRRPWFREDLRAIVRVTAADGSTPRGKVAIKVDGQRVRRGRLKDGRMAREIRRNLRPGKHRLVAVYRGSRSVERSRDVVRFRVTRR